VAFMCNNLFSVYSLTYITCFKLVRKNYKYIKLSVQMIYSCGYAIISVGQSKA